MEIFKICPRRAVTPSMDASESGVHGAKMVSWDTRVRYSVSPVWQSMT